MKKHTAPRAGFLLISLLGIAANCLCQSKPLAGRTAAIENFSSSISELVGIVRPSVVQIRTIGYGATEGQEVGWVAAQRGTGSGVILDSKGYIVTNAHVVKGSRFIEVWLNESNVRSTGDTSTIMGKRSIAATIVGIDNESDLAVIKIDRAGLVPLPLADSDELLQGQIVLAFGNPMALENSVSMGVVSSVERQLKPDDPSIYIQTDAPINPGNSGGPLVDAHGQMIGINTLIFSQSGGNEGIGFAIPSNVVKRIYAELCKNGHTHHGRIGILPLSITPSLASGLQLPRDWGVILEDVEPNGPADRAGLKPGDMIMTADGKMIKNIHQLLGAVDRHSIGETLNVSALRGNEKVEAVVTVAERADDPGRFLEMVSQKANLVNPLGVLAINMSDQLLKLVTELRKPAGVIVAARIAGSTGFDVGLAAGDLIISLNGKTVENLETLKEILRGMNAGDSAVLQVQREDQLRFVVAELP